MVRTPSWGITRSFHGGLGACFCSQAICMYRSKPGMTEWQRVNNNRRLLSGRTPACRRNGRVAPWSGQPSQLLNSFLGDKHASSRSLSRDSSVGPIALVAPGSATRPASPARLMCEEVALLALGRGRQRRHVRAHGAELWPEPLVAFPRSLTKAALACAAELQRPPLSDKLRWHFSVAVFGWSFLYTRLVLCFARLRVALSSSPYSAFRLADNYIELRSFS
ncbi:uncharacterized protein B0I36DRAFT_139702 [Microdochium trichocladiopsis]|uniref:Uncharacterized protein n=1 Tax=Microdochium trichocladiopsis TaxID=1682393 RepID=A0A9P8Y1S2_9PEZI|nr:uncharacterized protein B0I36DRAFT_139702 [Microdochium trichocladiopsis]KAH7027526.1 hypothetical protein B0I36DRAFT_139702 [Microdochium trichocladiopsis]